MKYWYWILDASIQYLASCIMSLKNKRVLITAGPTWVAIDDVRVISNIASGRTGTLLAQEATHRGARATLLLGPGQECRPDKQTRIIRFNFFKDLKNILRRELRKNKYDIIIHSAAVSDFRPAGISKGKISSGAAFKLNLLPLEKLVVLIRRLARGAKLVMFKLESGVTDKILIERAKSARDEIGADLVVANRLNPYRAFIIDRNGSRISVKSRKDLAKKLIKVLVRN